MVNIFSDMRGTVMASDNEKLRPYMGQLCGFLNQLPAEQNKQYEASCGRLAIQYNSIIEELETILEQNMSGFLINTTFEPLLDFKVKIDRLIGHLKGMLYPETFWEGSGTSTNITVNATNSLNVAVTAAIKHELISAIDKELDALDDEDSTRSTFEKIKERVKKSVSVEDVTSLVIGMIKGCLS